MWKVSSDNVRNGRIFVIGKELVIVTATNIVCDECRKRIPPGEEAIELYNYFDENGDDTRKSTYRYICKNCMEKIKNEKG